MILKNCKSDDHKGVFSLFGYADHRLNPRVGLGSALIMGTLLVGCGGQQTRDEPIPDHYTDQSARLFADDPAASELDLDSIDVSALMGGERPNTQGRNASEQVGGWSIMLTKVGNAGMDRAQELLRVIQADAGLHQAFIEQRPDGLVIAYGNYFGRDEAVEDLERVRKTQLLGTTPFESAIIMPPSSDELRGSNPRHDLRTAKQRYGKQAVYTLQVGVYGRVDYQSPSPEELAAYRKAAEEAVRDLRSQGETAFYYHAPARSMVTVGVFGEKDFDNTTLPPYQSPMLKRTREKFPNNLLNGAGINEAVRTETGRMKQLQSSQLVAIPEK